MSSKTTCFRLHLYVLISVLFLPAAAAAQTNIDHNGRPIGRSAVPPMRVSVEKSTLLEVFNGSDLDVPGAFAPPAESALSTLGSRAFLASGFHVAADAPENSFRVAIDGRVGLGTDSPRGRLHVVAPTDRAGARDLLLLDENGNLEIAGILSEASSVLLKHAFRPVDGPDVLDRLLSLEINTWSYTSDVPRVRHMGPTAQDFRSAFGLGDSDESIAVLDASGVTMAAVQALAHKVMEQEALISELRETNAELLRRIQDLERQ